MANINFITVRLGKDSIPEIQKICSSESGIIMSPFLINVKCTQVPDTYKTGDYAFIWLGSDNNKGMATKWKQGFKAVGRVKDIFRGKNYNDTSETIIEVIYIFFDSINRLDILRCAPMAYYWCSSMPLIGIDDHANQTIRNMSGGSFSDIRAFFSALESSTNQFKKDIIKVDPRLEQYFNVEIPSPKLNPTVNNLSEINTQKASIKCELLYQQIFYGAPGTGKSYAIETATEGEDVIRTTFHPDSDYSTFVGAYKPTTKEVPVISNFGGKAIKVKDEDGNDIKEERIVYEFVNQAFLQAYVSAWKKLAENTIEPKKQYLVIEEINRGNCAQIFGDLFQLLDRNPQGFSEYPIKADADMKKQLKKQLAGLSIENAAVINAMYKNEDVVSKVLDGDILLLPCNLFIWATMNTSDQSLFPIDSAFKRRWDWKYVPIANAGKNWAIDANGKKYDWWDFLNKINALIGETTNSEDKKLGYFFCKTQTGIIDAETFVGKVIFYLWNDVFKDFEFEGDVFVDTDGETKLTFDKFYKPDATVQESSVEVFLNNLGVMLLGEEPAKDEDAPADDEEEPVGRTRYLINGDKFKRKSYFGKEIMMQFIKSHPELTYQEIKDLFPDSLMGDTTFKGLIASTDTQLGSYARFYSPETLTSADGVSYKIFKQWTYQNIGNIINFGKEHGFNIEIIEE